MRGTKPYGHADQNAAVYTLLCYRKLVHSPESLITRRTVLCQHTFDTHIYVNTTQYCIYTFVCVQ